jgi:hypothetical protein
MPLPDVPFCSAMFASVAVLRCGRRYHFFFGM